MEPKSPPPPDALSGPVRAPAARSAWFAALAAGGVAIAILAYVIGRVTATPVSLLPQASTTTTTVTAGPNVLVAVRDLKRLETETFHFERVIDMKRTETQLYGIIEGNDRILLVAAGDVSAGVDLSELKEGDVDVDWDARKVTITLPPAQIFHSALDEEKTHVHDRTTDLLAHRDEKLETDARVLAQSQMAQAAKDAHILDRAADSAKKTVEQLLRSLGFTTVIVNVRS